MSKIDPRNQKNCTKVLFRNFFVPRNEFNQSKMSQNDSQTSPPPFKNVQGFLFAILMEKVILNTFSRVTFFDLRLSFARNEVFPKMNERFAAKCLAVT